MPHINIAVALSSAFHNAYPDAEHRLGGRFKYEEFLTRHSEGLLRLCACYSEEAVVSLARTVGRISGQHCGVHGSFPNDIVLYGRALSKHLDIEIGAVFDAYSE